MNNLLLNTDFLKQLDLMRNKTVYSKLIAINAQGAPVEEITGRVTSGTINVDGSSVLRRTCNITLVGQDLKISEFYWALKSQFRVEIGIKNNIDDNFDNIIWFEQGTYIITSFSKSKSLSGINISVSGQDKMCLLNGSLGGALPHDVDFGTYKDENGIDKALPVIDIIKQALTIYAREPYYNIVINDLEGVNGWSLQQYRGETPMYYWYKVIKTQPGSNSYTKKLINVTIDSDKKVKRQSTGKQYTLKNLPDKCFYSKNNVIGQENTGEIVESGGKEYVIQKIEYGQDAGYHRTELTYPDALPSKPDEKGALELAAGEPLTNLFDKIKTFLGEYEYFYDLKGRFVFQKKQIYTQGLFTPIVGDNAYVVPATDISAYKYKFNDATLISSYSNGFDITNIKNDIIVWGTKTTVAGGDKNIHGRFAIHKKPTKYYSLTHKKSFSTTGNNKVDWRELIYLMAEDHSRLKTSNTFITNLINKNPEFYTGVTGYEQYYIDMLSYWRKIYKDGKFIIASPSEAEFWIDFIEPNGQLKYFSHDALGNRVKVDKNAKVKAMWYEDIPEIEFIYSGEKVDYSNTAYQRIQIPNKVRDLFIESPRQRSVFEQANELINSHILKATTITLTSLPIYYLEPNTRIYVKDEESEIDGDYIIKSFSIPLNPGGNMSIQATEIINTFI